MTRVRGQPTCLRAALASAAHMSIHPNGIRAHYWAITHDRRDMPKVDIIILLHRRATVAVTACITTALEDAFEDNAQLSVAVTMNSKAFRSIVKQRIL